MTSGEHLACPIPSRTDTYNVSELVNIPFYLLTYDTPVLKLLMI